MKNEIIQKGFTLIELIIVIVILGILATLALPKIMGQMEASKAAEAMNMFGAYRRVAHDCMHIAHGSAADCLTASQLGLSTTSVANGAAFQYSSQGVDIGLASQYVTIRAVNRAGTAAICMDILYDAIADAPLAAGYSAAPVNSIYEGVVNRAISNGASVGSACDISNLPNLLN